MWANFDGKAYSQDQFRTKIASLTWNQGWTPEGITLHNTAAPNLAQWAESGSAHDARIRNLENYYESELGWHAGPHLFISRNWINGFSNILKTGVHSRCWNATRFGVEMVGDYNVEPFNSGDGAKVRDNAVFAVAVLNNKFGFDPAAITFHKECLRDNHDCPGRLVVKADFITLVRAKMKELAGLPPAPTLPAPPTSTILFHAEGKMSTFGGPRDMGMSSTEGLALYETDEDMAAEGLGDWLLTPTQANASGLGRRLRPEKPYLACRWDYHILPKSMLRHAQIEVTNPTTGKSAMARAVDWGPNANTGRVADLSPGLARELGLNTDDVVRIRIYKGAV